MKSKALFLICRAMNRKRPYLLSFFLLIFLLSALITSCSKSGSSGFEEVFLLNQLDKQPEFEGGYEQFILYISEGVKKAPEGRLDEIEEKIFIDFIIDKDGSVSNVTLKNPLPSGAAKELKLILENSPAWTPGHINGQPVASFQTLPIQF